MLIKNYPAADVEPARRWISVKERLPKEPCSCLVVVDDSDPYTGAESSSVLPYVVGYDGDDGESKMWIYAEGIQIPFKVMAWWKVPEPPKMD